MSLKIGVDLSEVQEVSLGDESVFGPGGVQNGGGVTLAQNESIGSEGFLGVLGIIMHTALIEEQDGHQLSHRRARSWVA